MCQRRVALLCISLLAVSVSEDCPSAIGSTGASLLQKPPPLPPVPPAPPWPSEFTSKKQGQLNAPTQNSVIHLANSAGYLPSSVVAEISAQESFLKKVGARYTISGVEWQLGSQNPSHALIFFLILVVGTAMHVLPWKTVWKGKGASQKESKDSIAGTETLAGSLTENTQLLEKAKCAQEAASSFLDLLPNTASTALCKDGSDPRPITFQQLRAVLTDPAFAAAFRPQDRVAIVLENGMDMALCLLAVMHSACAVPLNPTYTAAELTASMEQMKCSAVIIQEGRAGEAARQAASSLGLHVFNLKVGKVGKLLSLKGPKLGLEAEQGVVKKSREILLLKTSGTTSKGKVVTFTLDRLSKAARYNARCALLGRGSICLSMMPLYHIAGISVNLLASLSAGATVLFYSGTFHAERFAAELERPDNFKPTWYFAVPAVHEALLSHVAGLSRPFQHRLRLIRSAGASLPQETGLRLIQKFACAVTPAYGMTEALEITCPPADYQLQKPGSVGPSINAEIKLVDGEVCIRGDLVMTGYEFDGPVEDDPNKDAWTSGIAGKGHLRTGDLGHMDRDGWLFLTGRSKEMINRGGETINPHEVEPVLASHPDIDIVVCFAAPHEALGECIAAAVVLKEGVSHEEVTPKILHHCSSRASETMRPEVLVYLPSEALPKTATKKFIRAGLAGRLGLTLEMVKASKVCLYSEASRSLEPTELEAAAVTLRDSLGGLRQSSNQELMEQQLKDGISGFAILQVLTKHWYQGAFDPHLMGDFFYGAYVQFARAELIGLMFFFLLSGHTAYRASKDGFHALLTRWLGLYTIMTLTASLAIATSSCRVDWYFSLLMLLEMIIVGMNMACSNLPAALGEMRWVSAMMLTTVPFLLLAAYYNSEKLLLTPYQQFEEVVGKNNSCPLTGTWQNVMLGQFSLEFSNWNVGLLGCWAASVSLGFHLLPRLSKHVWASDRSIFYNRSVRIISCVAFMLLLYNHSDWPHHDDGGEGTERYLFPELWTICVLLAVSLLTIALGAVAIGGNASFLQALGKCAVGCLMTQTLFERRSMTNFCVWSSWPFHDVLNFELLRNFHEWLPLVAMIVTPFLFILSIGKWATQATDLLLQRQAQKPHIIACLWPVMVVLSTLVSQQPGTPMCTCTK